MADKFLPIRRRYRQFLSVKVTLGVVLPLMMILSAVTFVSYSYHRQLVFNNLSQMALHSGQIVEKNLRHLMLVSDFKGVQELLASIIQEQSFRNAYIINTSGKVIFAPTDSAVGLQLDYRNQDCQPCHRLLPDLRPNSVVMQTSDGVRVFRSMQPIENSPACFQCHDPEERLLGLLLSDISFAPFEASINADIWSSLFWWICSLFITVLVVNFVLNRFVLRRLKGMASAIKSMRESQVSAPLHEGEMDEIGQLARAFNTLLNQVERREAEKQALTDQLALQSEQRGELLKSLISAQEDERKRVARELHDELGQSLGGLALQTQVIQKLIPKQPQKAQEQLTQTRQLIAKTSEQMYGLILALRPSVLDDLGLAVALQVHANQVFNHSEVLFEMDTSRMKSRLPAELETLLYRVFQEALNNIVRYANARRVKLSLAGENGLFEGEVRDDGCGFDPRAIRIEPNNPRGLGLLGMQERVALSGGKIEIQSQPGKGTCIRISIPFSEMKSD